MPFLFIIVIGLCAVFPAVMLIGALCAGCCLWATAEDTKLEKEWQEAKKHNPEVERYLPSIARERRAREHEELRDRVNHPNHNPFE